MSTKKIDKKVFLKNKNGKKLFILTVLLTALLATGVYGTTQVMADDISNYPPIVQKIASKFGLNEADVNEVFLQERSDNWGKRRQALSDQLEQAVKDGKITEDQKQKILDKKDEIQADRVAQRQQFRNDMQQWMTDNGIDANALMPYLGFGGFGRKNFHQIQPMN